MAADDDDTPVDAPRPSRAGTRRRLQSATERDIESDRARKERDSMTASGEVLDPVPDEITGRYEGDELEMYRNRRTTDERIVHLERKHDKLTEAHQKLADSISRVANDVSEMRGEMKVLPRLVDALEKAADRRADADHVTLTAKVDVERARALEPVEAAKARRGWITSIIAIVMTLAAGTMAFIQARGC